MKAWLKVPTVVTCNEQVTSDYYFRSLTTELPLLYVRGEYISKQQHAYITKHYFTNVIKSLVLLVSNWSALNHINHFCPFFSVKANVSDWKGISSSHPSSGHLTHFNWIRVLSLAGQLFHFWLNQPFVYVEP